LLGQPGIVKILAYNNVGYIADIREINNLALATGGSPPDVSILRNKHTKPGLSFSLAQQLYSGIGLFVRAGITDGRYETISYADVDKMISGGLVFSGEIWKRPNDEIGIATALGALQKDRQIYFALGGTSIDIGDGMLNYNSEKALEVFYRWTVLDWLETTFDYQFISNPGYNSDRGPVNLFAIRTRARF
jgi:high affinity Mn2+ porin